MPTFKLKITRRFYGEESTVVEVDAPTAEDAIEAADAAYMAGDYEGRCDIEWDENADAWDAFDHEIEGPIK